MQIIDTICEAVICSIRFDALNSDLAIEFEHNSTGRKWRFTASGVVEYAGWDFRFTNIVQEIAVYSDLDSDSVEVKDLVFGALEGRARGNDEDVNSPLVNKLLLQIAKGQLQVVSLEAVFGSEMIIVAKNFELSSLR